MIQVLLFSVVFSLAEQSMSDAACFNYELPVEEVFQGPIGERSHEFLQQMTGEGFSGAVLISRQGQLLLKSGYGYADRDNKLRNTSETLFNVASIAKTFTAAAVLQLEAQGRLSLDDRLGEFLGPFPDAKTSATVHHLLTHTAGLVVRGADLSYGSRHSFVESMKEAPIESIPGADYRYTNAGYTLLAAIVEELTGLPFQSLLDRQIFKPACMARTAYVWDSRIQGQRTAVGYAGDTIGQLRATAPEQDVWGNRGPGSVATTVGDLYKWTRAIRDTKVLSPESIDKMFTAYVGDEGYGWHVIDSEYGRLVRRGGGLPGFESSIRWYMDHDVVIVLAINNHLRLRLPVVHGLEEIIFVEDRQGGPTAVAREKRHD
jgi:CubicO group peptidase (beta-lactamase class C family)